MNRLMITRLPEEDGRILTTLLSENRVLQMEIEDGEASILGNIYIGKVKHIVKNINAAFVEFQRDQNGYYSLSENLIHLFADGTAFTKDGRPRPLREGDEILVQVSRDAVKTKDPVLTGNLSFTGKYCVLTAGKRQISISSKITDASWRMQMKEFAEELMKETPDVGLILRTNAKEVDPKRIKEEFSALLKQYERILELGKHRTVFSLLSEADPSYILRLRDTYQAFMEEIVTDQEDIYEAIKNQLLKEQPEDLLKLRFYQDPMISLWKLYSMDAALERALSRRVWLRSGGYLVIDHTEAMTVIDVNTGKYSGKKNARETIRKINLEAASEIAAQMRLRNLSGIILIDFIDMKDKEDQELLLKTLSGLCRQDPIKTSVVDLTKLNLVEVTRKKIRKPFYEQLGKNSSVSN